MTDEYTPNPNNIESDYEFVYNSDSEELEVQTVECEKACKGSSSHQNLILEQNVEKINLNLSLDKIYFNSHVKQISKRKSSFQSFQIRPVNETLKRKEDKIPLPEIVLTSFENPFENNRKPKKKMASKHEFHREDNSPSPETYLDIQLSGAESSSSSRNSSSAGFYNDNLLGREKQSTNMNLAVSKENLNPISGNGQSLAKEVEESIPIPLELKCKICDRTFRDPRTLNCLHSFCFDCLVDDNYKRDNITPLWSVPDQGPEWRAASYGDEAYSLSSSPTRRLSRSSQSSYKGRKSIGDLVLNRKKSASNKIAFPQFPPGAESTRSITCTICEIVTDLPVGGIRQLPTNYVLIRKIEDIKFGATNAIISQVWCSLCDGDTTALYHCLVCATNMCTYCKDSHERQRKTSHHQVKNLLEMRKQNKEKRGAFDEQFVLKCSMHVGFEIKFFCYNCMQTICSDCQIILHKTHKTEPVSKAFKLYSKVLKEATDKTRPLCEYTDHSISRLNDIAKRINNKCDQIQSEINQFMVAYYEAVEVHEKTLNQQVSKARENKMQMILEQQLDLEKRSADAEFAVRFTQELFELGNETEILSFLSILLKRLDFCQKFQPPMDPKISNTLNFLSDIQAPSTKSQNYIPLFGILTTQIVEPQLCSLETDGFTQLRLHKKVEFILTSRDTDGVTLCHGGLSIRAQLKYKEFSAKTLPVEINDRRDGKYGVSFIPDSPGTLNLLIQINEKHIKGSPYTLVARAVRPHNGIFHCCSFCSSKGSKTATCACDGHMENFNGCGHGHQGHPGRRHWSCCGNVLENSECSVSNKLLHPVVNEE